MIKKTKQKKKEYKDSVPIFCSSFQFPQKSHRKSRRHCPLGQPVSAAAPVMPNALARRSPEQPSPLTQKKKKKEKEKKHNEKQKDKKKKNWR